MESAFYVVLAVLVFAAGIGIAVLGYLAAKRRREEMAAYAGSRGWSYTEEDDRLVDRYDGAPFGRGHGRRAFNVVRGEHDGRAFESFDYVYKTTQSNGKTTTTVTHPFSVLAMAVGATAPALSVEPEGFFDNLLEAVTGSAIDLESIEFNDAFTVRCPDRKFASDVLHPRMMEFLLQHRDVAWRFERDTLLVVESGERAIVEIDRGLAFMDGVLDLVPTFVWESLR